jgi:ferrous iron transport protein B
MAKLISRFVVKGESSPFVMELPPYRMPSAKSVSRHTWEKGKQYLKKMGTTILLASIAVWALSYFPHHAEATEDQQMELSYIGQIGKFVEPVIQPCGLAWKEGVALIAGIGAKEIVASTMAVLYHGDIATSGMTTLAALSFMLFALLYMPCIPTCIGIKNESGKWKWAVFTALYTTLLAWLTATLVYQVGSLLALNS